MSVKVMSLVWEAEGLSPTHRLILLSLADHANDEGMCYPSIRRLAKRTGLSERAVQGAAAALQAAGWLRIERNAGPKGCNLFTVCTPAANAPPQQVHPRRKCTTPPQQVRPPPAGDAPEPSLNHQEPSEEEANASLSPAGDARAFDEIAHAVTAYNAAAEASGWPTVRILSKARRSALAARLREAGGLAGWEAALSKAQASPHCCGENDRGWTANFDFLTRQSSFAKLMEGNYDNRNHAGRAEEPRRGSGMVATFAAVAARRQAADGGR